jgi:hypothetical protein
VFIMLVNHFDFLVMSTDYKNPLYVRSYMAFAMYPTNRFADFVVIRDWT